jgi:hypothetical protein
MKAILYTSTRCPKCPSFRKLLREAAREHNLSEGKDFVEKLIDGENAKPGQKMKLEGEEMHIVDHESKIVETPAAVGGQDFTIEALQYQIASTPALVIDDELAFIGEVPTKDELMARLKD